MVNAQSATKQNLQQIKLRAVPCYQSYARGQSHQVDGGQAGIFFQGGEAAYRACNACHQQARSPPTAMLTSERPLTIKSMTTPGSTAWLSASPSRLMRRRVKNTPKGAAHKSKFDEGATQCVPHRGKHCVHRSTRLRRIGQQLRQHGVEILPVKATFDVANGGGVIPRFGHDAGALQVGIGQHLCRGTPSNALARQ
jgi:hypothetical protein